MYCLNCGSPMTEGSKFCISCGAKVENIDSVQEKAAQEAAVSVEGATAVVEEAVQPAQSAQPDPKLEPQPPVQSSVQPVPKPEPPQPVQQPVQQPSVQQHVQPAQVSQPKPAQSSFTQPAPQQPVQPIQQSYVSQQAVPQPAALQKPEKITPLPVWKYIGIFLIMGIPILGIVMVFVWAFGNSFNRNTKNYARAILITFLIFLVLSIIGYFTIWANILDIFYNLYPSSGLPITN